MRDRVGHRRRALPFLAAAVVLVGSLAAALDPTGDSTVDAAGVPITSAYPPVGPLRLADIREPVCGCLRFDGQTIGVDIGGPIGLYRP